MAIQVFGYPTTLDVLLTTLVNRLVNSGIILPNGSNLLQEQVRLTLETEDQIEKDPNYDQFLTFAPADFPVNDGAVTGGGNALMETDGTIELQFYSRLDTDYTHLDVNTLTDPVLGILASWRQILKALHLFVPVDNFGNGLVCEPIKCRNWKVPRRKKDCAWVRIYSTWLMPFVEAL